MIRTIFIQVLLTQFAFFAPLSFAADGGMDVKPARAEDYSLGADILRGRVVSLKGKEVTIRDVSSGKLRTVKVTNPIVYGNITAGDLVRVAFSNEPNTASKIIKEKEGF